MQYFSSLKFHDRWWVRMDIKAFSEAMKMHLIILTDTWRTQAQQGRAGHCRKGCISHVSLLLGLSWGTESIECSVIKQITPILCVSCYFSSSRSSPFLSELHYLNVITFRYFSIYISSTHFPVGLDKGQNEQPLCTRCYTNSISNDTIWFHQDWQKKKKLNGILLHAIETKNGNHFTMHLHNLDNLGKSNMKEDEDNINNFLLLLQIWVDLCQCNVDYSIFLSSHQVC